MAIIEKAQAMSDADLAATWEALRNYNPREMYDAENTMDDWAQTVYSEVTRRDVPAPVILDEYCWMHTPGGWKCGICYRELKREESTVAFFAALGLYVAQAEITSIEQDRSIEETMTAWADGR